MGPLGLLVHYVLVARSEEPDPEIAQIVAPVSLEGPFRLPIWNPKNHTKYGFWDLIPILAV